MRCDACDAAAAVGPPAPPGRGGLWKKLILTIVVTFSGCMGWDYWLLQTRDYEGVVQSVSWQRTLTRQAFTSVQRRGWRDQLQERASILPVNGLGEFVGTENIRDCVEKQRGTRQVAVGTERVCINKTRSVACGSHESCSTRDLGNGFAEEVCSDVTDYCNESYEDCRDETKYRTDPVFAQECAYGTYEWQQLDQRSVRGGSEPPVWPELTVEGELERLVPAERYEVVLEYQDDGLQRARVHPTDAADFAQWPPGRKLTLVVQNSGKVVGIREGDKTLPVEAAKP